MTPKQLYDAVFQIGMIAETGHFKVKQEAYQDFKAGGDLESAEMMLFDIIDEITHVQYTHRWLPVLAEHARVDNSDYRERAVEVRKRFLTDSIAKANEAAKLPRDESDPEYAFYQKMLTTMRKLHPLSNANTCPPRTQKPI